MFARSTSIARNCPAFTTKFCTMSQKRKTSSIDLQTKKQKTSVASADIKAEIAVHKGPYPKEIDPKTNKETVEVSFTHSLPKRNKNDILVFEDWPEFRPNMTPKEVLQAGSFGGTYYRPIKSSATGKSYSEVWKELPQDWLAGLNIRKQVSSPNYDEKVNTYKVKCGGSLDMWESSGWIHKQDPYGWFQWYCRFYQGRRSADDARQVGRWLRCAGSTGRWKGNLISKCVKSGCAYDNVAVSPVVRQTLQHWGYMLTKEDFEAGAKKFRKKNA